MKKGLSTFETHNNATSNRVELQTLPTQTKNIWLIVVLVFFTLKHKTIGNKFQVLYSKLCPSNEKLVSQLKPIIFVEHYTKLSPSWLKSKNFPPCMFLLL